MAIYWTESLISATTEWIQSAILLSIETFIAKKWSVLPYGGRPGFHYFVVSRLVKLTLQKEAFNEWCIDGSFRFEYSLLAVVPSQILVCNIV